MIPIGVIHEAFAEVDTAYGVIIRELRLPRAILALAIGAALGVAGAALQGPVSYTHLTLPTSDLV